MDMMVAHRKGVSEEFYFCTTTTREASVVLDTPIELQRLATDREEYFGASYSGR